MWFWCFVQSTICFSCHYLWNQTRIVYSSYDSISEFLLNSLSNPLLTNKTTMKLVFQISYSRAIRRNFPFLIHSMRPQNVLWNRIRFLCWVILFITRSIENFYKMNACLRTLSVSQGLIVCLLLPLENDAFLIVYRSQWLVNSPSSPPTHSSPMESLFHERTRKEAKTLILSTVFCFSLFWFSSDKCIGVADGVGGWATCGVDPGEFSRKVCLHFHSVHF